MKFSKQTLLGTGVFLGGSLLLYSVIHQVQQTSDNAVPATVADSATHPSRKTTPTDSNPLTADIATEQKILAQKQQEREQRVNELDRQAEQYLTEQQRIEAAALARTRAENQLYADKSTPLVTPIVTPRPVETVTNTPTTTVTTNAAPVAPKPQITSKPQAETTPQDNKVETTPDTRPTSYQIKKGEGLIGLSRRYNVPVTILAKVNSLSPSANLHPGQVLTIPSENQVARIQQAIEQEASDRQAQIQAQKQAAEQAKAQAQIQAKLKAQQQAELIAKQKAEKQAQLQADRQAKIDAQKAKIAEQQAIKRQQELEKAQKIQEEKARKAAYQASQQKLKEARQEVKETDAKGTFGVQVALAADDDKANEIAKKLRSAGYSVKTSQTSRGVRVVVGPEKGKVAALALKDKVNSDPRVNMGSAWVLYW